MNPYDSVDHIATLYELLQDDLSRSIFWARLQFDFNPTMNGAIQLLQFSEGYTEEEILALKTWKKTFRKLHDAQKQIFLYGAGSFGRLTADLILREGEDFFAFCDRRASEPSVTLDILGKSIYSPNYLFENMDQCYVVITTTEYYREIEQYLCQNGFMQDHILPFHFEKYFGSRIDASGKQYLEFPNLFKQNTTFVDAGCFDGENSIQFAKWCRGNYESILAFEPDAENYHICKERMKAAGLHDIKLIQAGLACQTGTSKFISGLDDVGYIIDEKQQSEFLVDVVHNDGEMGSIQTVSLDELVDCITVGFIKMDIEGSELRALQGAQNTIKRDKPFMAISVYHRRGDVLAIMGYLHQLVPEYRFWIRHYGPLEVDTVLFASIE